MMRPLATALASAGLLAAAAAGAAPPGEPARLRGPLERAWRDATEMATRSLGEEDAGRLTMLAYAVAVGRTCPGLSLDGERYKAKFHELAEARSDQLTDDRKTRSQLRRISYHLGVATGIFLAEHALDGERFCTGARTSIAADPEIAALFSAAPASAPAP